MSLYEEIWNEKDYEPRNEVYLFHMLPNHMALINTVNYGFEDYKIYSKLPCLPAERKFHHCLNHYGGMKFMFEDRACHEVYQYFQTCVEQQRILGQLKRTNPEYFATNEYSRSKPSFSEIAV